MTLIEDARRLLDHQPLGSDGVCVHCHKAPTREGHAFDCPWWLPHDRILAALEAAEVHRLIREYPIDASMVDDVAKRYPLDVVETACKVLVICPGLFSLGELAGHIMTLQTENGPADQEKLTFESKIEE